jgi:hypothetical protein
MRGKVISSIILVLLLGPSVSAQVDYLVVDDFDSYADNNNLRAVWKDWWFNPASQNGAEVFVETDPNFTRDSDQSMKYTFKNFNVLGGKYVGSEAEAATADLQARIGL